jgi:hypothetical protein
MKFNFGKWKGFAENKIQAGHELKNMPRVNQSELVIQRTKSLYVYKMNFSNFKYIGCSES